MGSNSKKYKNKENPSLNEDRGDAWWQEERGPRYGNSRKVRSRGKVFDRRKRKREDFDDLG
jgi:hypothetical protein